MLDAGAGTGKTTVMAQRYVEHLLASDQRATRLTEPGPRPRVTGTGQAGARLLAEWPGLVPAEVVAITFTVKAADELRQRIRSELLARVEGPRADPRLQGRPEVAEALAAALDEAPIGTIDSFLQRLVLPHLAWLLPMPPERLVRDDERLALAGAARDRVWRLRSPGHARWSGVPEALAVPLLAARDRVLAWSGGRAGADERLRALMGVQGMVDAFGRTTPGLWEQDEVRLAASLEARVRAWCDGAVAARLEALEASLRAWWEALRDVGEAVELADALAEPAGRVGVAADLLETQPLDVMQRLVRLHRLRALLQGRGRDGRLDGTWLAWGLPASGDGWDHGLKRTRDPVVKGHQDAVKAAVSDGRGEVLLALAAAAEALVGDPWPEVPAEWWAGLTPGQAAAPPATPADETTAVSRAGALRLVIDLSVLVQGTRAIREQMVLEEGRFDHSDIQSWAEELLLQRPPRRLHGIDPRALAALEQGPSEPWCDDHVARAWPLLQAAEDQAAVEDVLHRVLAARRGVRALIVDEFQDTNTAQWRLLGRLLGARDTAGLRRGDPGLWGPTVCLVGDRKQSIYRFRQAQVEVMRTASAQIEYAVAREVGDPRLAGLLDPTGVRQPARGRGGGGFQRASELAAGSAGTPAALLPWPDGARPGRVELRRNHRTLGGLLRTVDALAGAVLDPSLRDLDGSWHAEPQELVPGRGPGGRLDWLVPAHASSEDGWSRNEREHELLAARLRALLDGRPIGEEAAAPVAAEDVLILVPRRTHQTDLLARLARWGVPALPERGGGLLERPIVRDLVALASALARPWRVHDVAWLASSAVVGLTDQTLEEVLGDDADRSRPFARLVEVLGDDPLAGWLVRWRRSAAGGDLAAALREALEATDLLVAHAGPTALADAEQFVALVHEASAAAGDDAVRTLASVERWLEAPPGAVPAPAAALPGAVRVLTIHGSKGLEAPVVALVGLFDPAHSPLLIEQSSGVLATPDWVAGSWRPWRDGLQAHEGMWQLGRRVLRSQAIAEQRRLLYVGLTRVRDHLILVGAPEPTERLEDGRIRVPLSASRSHPALGTMLVDGLSAITAGAGPWRQHAARSGTELRLPAGVNMATPSLGVAGLDQMLVLSSVEQVETPPLAAAPADAFARRLARSPRPPEPPPPAVGSGHIQLRLPPHGLDVAAGCRRRSWLEHGLGLRPTRAVGEQALRERLEAGGRAEDDRFDPATLGLVVHDLLERAVGAGVAPDPGEGQRSPGLQWRPPGHQRLIDPEQQADAFASQGVDDASDALRRRVARLATLLATGPAGDWLDGRGGVTSLEAEWAFRGRLDRAIEPFDRVERPGAHAGRRIERVRLDLEGRVDLIVRGEDMDGPWVQVIDLKTEGCAGPWPEAPDPAIHPQAVPPTAEARTPAEAAMLQRHRMQLTVYTRMLADLETARAAAGLPTATVRPPAILNAANGRLIALTPAEYDAAQADLDTLLGELARIDAGLPEARALVAPLPLDRAETCARCPLYSGPVRLCAPAPDAVLDAVHADDDSLEGTPGRLPLTPTRTSG